MVHNNSINKLIVADGYNMINMYFNKGHRLDNNFILDHKECFDGFRVYIKNFVNYCNKNNSKLIVFFDGEKRFSEETKLKKKKRILRKINEGRFGLIKYVKNIMSQFLKDYAIYHCIKCDCDDLIASCVKLHMNKFEKVIILSEDNDFTKYSWGNKKPDIIKFLSSNNVEVFPLYRNAEIWSNEKEINDKLFKYKYNDTDYDLLPLNNSEFKDDKFISNFTDCYCIQSTFSYFFLKNLKKYNNLKISYSRRLIKAFNYNLEENLINLKIIRGILINHLFQKIPNNFKIKYKTYNNHTNDLISNELDISNFEYNNIEENKEKFRNDPLYFINNPNWKNKWLKIKNMIENHYQKLYYQNQRKVRYESKKAFNFEWYNIISTASKYLFKSIHLLSKSIGLNT